MRTIPAGSPRPVLFAGDVLSVAFSGITGVLRASRASGVTPAVGGLCAAPCLSICCGFTAPGVVLAMPRGGRVLVERKPVVSFAPPPWRTVVAVSVSPANVVAGAVPVLTRSIGMPPTTRSPVLGVSGRYTVSVLFAGSSCSARPDRIASGVRASRILTGRISVLVAAATRWAEIPSLITLFLSPTILVTARVLL